MESQSSPKKLKLKIKIGGGGYIVAGMFHFYTLKANFYYIKLIFNFQNTIVETMCVPIVPFDILYIHYVFRIYHAFYA